MRKSSLGQRSSVRKSYLPRPRDPSWDRLSAVSSTHSSTLYGGGTERPSRLNSVSVGRSLGGPNDRSQSFVSNRKDDRPIQTKEWQNEAAELIENVLRQSPEGHDIIGEGGIRPLTLTKFIGAVQYMCSHIDSEVIIAKSNYIHEITFWAKKMMYRGKVEKSWLQTVNTMHGLPYALAFLHFLATRVYVFLDDSADNDIFVENGEEESDMLDWNLVQKFCFELYMARDQPGFEDKREALEQQLVDNFEARICPSDREQLKLRESELKDMFAQKKSAFEAAQEEVEKLRKQLEELERQNEEGCVKRDNAMRKCEEALEAYQDLIRSESLASEKFATISAEFERVKSLTESPELENRQPTVAELLQVTSVQNSYKKEYEDILFDADLKNIALKKELQMLIEEFNLEVTRRRAAAPEAESFILSEIPRELNDKDKYFTLLKKFRAEVKDILSGLGTSHNEALRHFEETEKEVCHLKKIQNQLAEEEASLHEELYSSDENIELRKLEREAGALSQQLNELRSKKKTAAEGLEKKKKMIAEIEAKAEEANQAAAAIIKRKLEACSEFMGKYQALLGQLKKNYDFVSAELLC